jgi:spermidine synthase
MASRTDRPWTRPLLLAVFFLSGASGLVYEIVWTRRLTHVFGSTTLAISTVLAAFMGGFALGAYRLGRSADRRPERALGVYGMLEIGIAAAALAVPLFLRLAQAAYLAVAPPLESSPRLFFLLQFLLVGAVLVVPTALMGGTLPVLSRWLVKQPGDVEKRVSALYAANTLGAGAGTAAATYVLLPAIGLFESELVAVAANLVAGAIALVLDLQTRMGAPRVSAGESTAPDASASQPPPIFQSGQLAPGTRALLAAIALSGFAAMVDEVAWSRVLALVLGSSVYSFGMMLLLFLVGLSIGSALFARVRSGRAVTVFAVAQAANTVAALAAIAFVPHLPTLFLRGFPAVRDSFVLLQIWNLALAAGLLLPSAILFGVAFPAAVAATTHHEAAGAGVGRVTVANTIGTVLGAFSGGFVLIPQLGLRATLAAAALATAGAAFCAAPLLQSRPLGRAVRIAAVAALGIAVLLPPWPLTLLVMGAGFYAPSYPTPAALTAAARQERLLYYKDGTETTLSVDQSGEYRYYRSNGKTDASTHPGDMANQLLLGHLPMLLHPDPRDVFVLGLGTGVSAAAMARYPVRSIEIVDIEAAAREATTAFAAENREILSDPRVRLSVADGRNALLSRRRSYDVILSDPSDVWVAGVGSLLTREFYALARARLRPHGVMVQWFHMHSLPPEQLKLLVATFQSVFPSTTLWRPNRGDVILMGTVNPLPWDYPRLAERVEKVPGVAEDLQRIGLWDPLAIFASFVLEGEDLKRLLSGVGAVHTDDRPVLEYLSPRAAYIDTTTVNDAAVQSQQTVFVPPMTRFDPERVVTPRVTYLLGFGHASLGRTDSAIRLMEDAVAREPGNAKYWIGLGNQYRVKDQRSRAGDAYRRALTLVPGEPEAADDLAALLRADGDDESAEQVLREALAASPADATLAAATARLLLSTGRAGDAAALLSPVSSRQPKNAELHLLLGLALAGSGKHRDADRELRSACALAPDNAGILRAAGKALLQVGSLAEAAAACTRADLLEPGNPETLFTLAEVAHQRGDVQGERAARQRAAEAAPDGPVR